MKRIIDISEEIYTAICDNGYIFDEDSVDIAKAIKNSTSVSNEGDLISRSALKKAFEDTVCIEPMPYAFVKQIIDNAPTINTTCPHCDSGYAQGYSDGYLKGKEERPHGKWLFKEVTDDHKVYGQCSVCKLRKRIDNYCPYCGAKMDRGEQ